jgi:hypothetical protein
MSTAKPESIDGIEIKRYSMSMTGKKLRKSLGISGRVYAAKSFKVCAKFKGIKVRSRLAFLKKMAKVVKERQSLEQIKVKRDGFDQIKLHALPLSESCLCYCCMKNTATLRHHVITLANGGRNKRNNIVPLCGDCHSKVHPHMNRKPKKQAKSEAVASWHSVFPKINGPVVVNPVNDKISVVATSA